MNWPEFTMLEVISIETDPEMPDAVFAALCAVVAPEKRARIHRYLHKQDAINTLIGDIVVRNAICAHTGLPNESLIFGENRHGKPRLMNIEGVHFNVSHSGNLVVCAISDKEVGVDIELIKPVRPKIAKRFFCRDECAFIEKNADDDAAFFSVWTMKESYIKWCGGGLSIPLDSFSVLELADLFLPIDIRADACCCLCSRSKQIDRHRHFIQADYLVRVFKHALCAT